MTEGSYEDETPATAQQGLMTAFNLGESSFERNFTLNTAPFKGLGPAYLRASCLDCHPGYGHGKRQQYYRAGFGNGYLLVIYHPVDGANSDDGPFVAEVTGMPQTRAPATSTARRSSGGRKSSSRSAAPPATVLPGRRRTTTTGLRPSWTANRCRATRTRPSTRTPT